MIEFFVRCRRTCFLNNWNKTRTKSCPYKLRLKKIITENYDKKLIQKIMRRNYYRKLWVEIITENNEEKLLQKILGEIITENYQLVYQSRGKCEIYRDTGVSKN